MIRAATASDIAAITGIYNDVIATTNAIYREDTVDVLERMGWFEDKSAHGYPVIVAEREGEVVGYGVFGSFRFGEGYNHTVEHSVHVAQSNRGEGIGRKILEYLMRLAKEQNRKVMVAAIDSTNLASIKLHASYGFKESARMPHVAQKHGQLLELVLMQLEL
jgi:phosphinothricin acetyltransferase